MKLKVLLLSILGFTAVWFIAPPLRDIILSFIPIDIQPFVSIGIGVLILFVLYFVFKHEKW